MANAYIRATYKGTLYDCTPPGPLALRLAMRRAGLRWETKAGQAVKIMTEIEDRGALYSVVTRLPTATFDWLSIFMPTMIFLVWRA